MDRAGGALAHEAPGEVPGRIHPGVARERERVECRRRPLAQQLAEELARAVAPGEEDEYQARRKKHGATVVPRERAKVWRHGEQCATLR